MKGTYLLRKLCYKLIGCTFQCVSFMKHNLATFKKKTLMDPNGDLLVWMCFFRVYIIT
jgi:hypothetical protein